MSVYTHIELDELNVFLERYSITDVQSLLPIEEGISNTIYRIDTQDKRYLLTLFEILEQELIDQYLRVNRRLFELGLPTANAISDNDGIIIQQLKQKPTVLHPYLPGHTILYPNPIHCVQIGKALAKIHLLSDDINIELVDSRDSNWRDDTFKSIKPHLSKEDCELLTSEIEFHKAHKLSSVPHGFIHADLFPDNVLFEQDKLSGIIDLYFSCHGPFIYDLAITYISWSANDKNEFSNENAKAILGAYIEKRPFNNEEISMWVVACRLACLRFWLSRLYDEIFPAPGVKTQLKDSDEFKKYLLDVKNPDHPLTRVSLELISKQ